MRRRDMERGLALDVARHEIATRLHRVCQDLAEADFAELVDRMAEIEVRYRLRDDWLFYNELTAQAQPRSLS